MGRVRRNAHDRDIARLAVPALGALLAEPLYVLADTAVVGHLGTAPLAGLAVASSVLLTSFAVFIFLAYGTTAAVGRLLGAGEEREAAHQAVQSLWLAVGIGVVVAFVAFVLSSPLVGALGATGAVRSNAIVYLRVSLLGVPPMLVVLAGSGYVRGLQDTRFPLAVAAGTASLNLVLELVLIYGFDRGIGASALATVLVQFVGAGLYLRRILITTARLGASVRPDRRAIGHLGRVGTALFVRTAALRASLVMNTAVAARVGTTDLGAHQIAFEIWSAVALGLDAIAIAAQALIARHLGAIDAAAARAAGRRMLEWGLAAGVAAGAVIAALAGVLPHVFSGDEPVVRLATFLLLLVAVMQPVNGLVFVLDGLLIGAGDMTFLARAMVIAFVAYLPFAAAVLVFDLGIGWLWLAIGVLMLSRLGVLGARWRSDGWAVTGARR